MMNRLLLLLGISLSFSCVSQTYNMYSYHSDPPYLLADKPSDLSRAWVAQFNQKHPNVQLKLVTIGRPELNALIEKGQPYMILWANPIWFKSRDKQVKASDPIFWDADIWISQQRAKVPYTLPEDLEGLTIGGRKGYFYKGVNKLVSAGRINRIDQLNDFANYEMLMKGNINAFVMSRSSYLYWQTTGVDTKPLYTAMSAHDAFTRHVLVSQNRRHLLPILNGFIQTMKADRDWQKQLHYWGVADLVNPFDIELDELDNLKVN